MNQITDFFKMHISQQREKLLLWYMLVDKTIADTVIPSLNWQYKNRVESQVFHTNRYGFFHFLSTPNSVNIERSLANTQMFQSFQSTTHFH